MTFGIVCLVLFIGIPIGIPVLVTVFALALSALVCVALLAVAVAMVMAAAFFAGIVFLVVGVARLALAPGVALMFWWQRLYLPGSRNFAVASPRG